MKGTDDEVQFGDVIELDAVKETKNGKIKHRHLECKFVPELLPLLLEQEVIEEKECEEEPVYSFPDSAEPSEEKQMIDYFLEITENMADCITSLEKEVKTLNKKITALQAEVNQVLSKNKGKKIDIK